MGTTTNVNPTPLDPSGWRLTFQDGFDGVYLDRANWPIVFDGQRYWNDAFTWQQEALTVWDGELQVASIASPQGWISGGLNMGWNGQLYGRFEVRARLDEGKGTSAAILLWPTDGEYPPEIDLMESPDPGRTVTSMTVHGEGRYQAGKQVASDASEWHTYAVDWLPDRITFYIDGVEQWTTTERVPQEPMALGFMGFVASSRDEWFGGAPDASTPGRVALHVDWARIWTPASLHPGEAPPAFYGDGAGSWGAAPEAVRAGVRAMGAERYQASVNAGEWGAVKAVGVPAGASWAPGTSDRLLFGNYEVVHLDLAAAPAGTTVQVIGAARGFMTGGAGADRVTWLAHADAASGASAPLFRTGAGDDQVLVTAPSASELWRPFSWGGRWDAGYDGRLTTATVIADAGADRVAAAARVTLLADGGAGNDTLVGGGANDAFRGGAGADDLTGGGGSDIFIYAPGQGGDTIRDFTPGQDRLMLERMGQGAVSAQAGPGGLVVSHAGEVLAVLAGVSALGAGDLMFA